MNYSNIKFNDISNTQGISVSLYVSGCPHQCKGCFNPETWDYDAGKEFTSDTILSILDGMDKNGIPRTLNILGGEPLCETNRLTVLSLVYLIRQKYPDRPIWIWTGYTKEELEVRGLLSSLAKAKITGFVDGRFKQEEKSYDLKMRGSSNQRIWKLEKENFVDVTNKF